MSKQGAGGPDPIGGGGGGGEPASQTTETPISEQLLWKARAEEAEEQVAQLQARITDLETELAAAVEAIASTERRGHIDRELTAARAIDLETARLLTESALGEMDEPDVPAAVRQLCARKPFLFACDTRTPSGPNASMSPHSPPSPADDLDRIAGRARTSGDRSELLRYLRIRRGS